MTTFDLNKSAERVQFILDKRSLPNPPTMRVAACFDVSGSMRRTYEHGDVQKVFDQLLALSLKFDDNGEIDVWLFDSESKRISTASSGDAGTFVNEEVMGRRDIWGGTNYANPLRQVVTEMFEEKKSGLFGMFSKKSQASEIPVLCLFITDGETEQESTARRILREASGKPIYFQMIGVGPSHHFSFLEDVADELPNVGFINLSSLNMSDDHLFEQLISEELTTWVKNFQSSARAG